LVLDLATRQECKAELIQMAVTIPMTVYPPVLEKLTREKQEDLRPKMIWYSMVLHPAQHTTGHLGDDLPSQLLDS